MLKETKKKQTLSTTPKTFNKIQIVHTGWVEPNQFDKNKSYYHKARYIEYEDGLKLLISYNTVVAAVHGDVFVNLWGGYSATTAKHINTFLNDNGFPKLCKKEWEKHYNEFTLETLYEVYDNI